MKIEAYQFDEFFGSFGLFPFSFIRIFGSIDLHLLCTSFCGFSFMYPLHVPKPITDSPAPTNSRRSLPIPDHITNSHLKHFIWSVSTLLLLRGVQRPTLSHQRGYNVPHSQHFGINKQIFSFVSTTQACTFFFL